MFTVHSERLQSDLSLLFILSILPHGSYKCHCYIKQNYLYYAKVIVSFSLVLDTWHGFKQKFLYVPALEVSRDLAFHWVLHSCYVAQGFEIPIAGRTLLGTLKAGNSLEPGPALEKVWNMNACNSVSEYIEHHVHAPFISIDTAIHIQQILSTNSSTYKELNMLEPGSKYAVNVSMSLNNNENYRAFIN